MGDSNEDFVTYHEEQKERRAHRLPIRQAEIQSLSEMGYTVKKLTEYQYRINDTYDLYPLHNRWHNIKTNTRGGAKSLIQFIIEKTKPEKPIP